MEPGVGGGCGQNGISAKKLSELIVFALDLCHLCRYNRPKWLIVSEKWARFFDHAAIKYTDVYANFEKFSYCCSLQLRILSL